MIDTYYNDRWEQEGTPLLEEAHLELWTAQEANDKEGIAAALEKEKQARAFFDSWLERFSTRDLFVQGCKNTPLPEFGQSADTAIHQVTDWLGGAAEAAHNYARIVKYGVGEAILHRFTGIPTLTGSPPGI